MSEAPTPSDAEQDEFDKAFEEQATRIAGEAPKPFVPEGLDDDDASQDAADGKPAPSQEQRQPEDPLKDAPENIRKAFESERNARLAAEHAARSNAGRVSALQRKLDEVKKTPQSDDAGGKSAPGAEPGDDDDESFGRDFPEVSGFVERRVRKLVEPVLQKAEQEKQEEEQRAYEAQVAEAFKQIADAHPDFDQIRGDAAYGRWLAQQPANVRNLAASEEAADAIALCDLYKAQTGKQSAPRSSRQHLIDAAEEIPSKGGARRNGVPDDFDAAFDHYALQHQSKRNQR